MDELTDRQAEIFAWISGSISEHGYAPTLREIALAQDMTFKCARDYVVVLERKGRLSRTVGQARTIRIVG